MCGRSIGANLSPLFKKILSACLCLDERHHPSSTSPWLSEWGDHASWYCFSLIWVGVFLMRLFVNLTLSGPVSGWQILSIWMQIATTNGSTSCSGDFVLGWSGSRFPVLTRLRTVDSGMGADTQNLARFFCNHLRKKTGTASFLQSFLLCFLRSKISRYSINTFFQPLNIFSFFWSVLPFGLPGFFVTTSGKGRLDI